MSRRGLLEFLELEEWVGQRWHRWASRAASYPHYPEAMVRFRELEKSLAVFFRLSGGDPGLELSVISARTSGHRLRWRQRLGFDEELLDLARVDEQHLLLPPHIDLLPDRDLNRDLYFRLSRTYCAGISSPSGKCGAPVVWCWHIIRAWALAMTDCVQHCWRFAPGGDYRLWRKRWRL